MENSPQDPSPSQLPEEEKRGVLNSLIVGAIGVLSAIYLFNPTAGIIELIPDNIPVVGNLDEAAAAALLISTLAYFGVDLGRLFGKARRKSDPNSQTTRTKDDAIDAEFVEH